MQIPGRSEGRRRSPKSVPDIFLYRHKKLTHAKGGDNVGERYLSSAAGATRGDMGPAWVCSSLPSRNIYAYSEGLVSPVCAGMVARCSIDRNAEAIKPSHEWTSKFEKF